jgi:bacterial/archaeal transporter family-2 protein
VSALFVLIALVAGTFNALEAGTNTALRKGLDAPFLSLAMISLTTLGMSLIAAFAMGERWPGGGQVSSIPWWGWTGGLLGFGFVTAMIYTAESLGAALFIGLTVTASTVASVVLDHFGLLGFAQHSAGTGRIVGALLMIAGVALFAIF